MPPESAATIAAAAPAAPLSPRAAFAILGSMLLLIVALTVVLVETTWAVPDTSVETPAPHFDSRDLAQR